MMDRRVKERLVGASILVVLFILVVPELLSGPKPKSTVPGIKLPASAPREPTRTVNVDLNTNKAAAGDPVTSGQTMPPAANPHSDPDPAAEPLAARPEAIQPGANPPGAISPGANAPGANPPGTIPPGHSEPEQVPPEQSTPLPALTKPGPAKPPAPQPRPAEAHGTWAVQAGTFQNRSNADALVHQLKAQGFSVAVSQSVAGKTAYYRVRSAAVADRAAADRLADKFKAGGHAASVVSLVH